MKSQGLRAYLVSAWLLASCGMALAVDKASLSEVANRAVRQAKLTASDGKPFYLKVAINETTNPDSDYKGEIEEYWVSPRKWRRTVQSPGFSQTLIFNDGRLAESDTGDYYPFWLRDLVTAIFDPLPMFDEKASAERKRFEAKMTKPAAAANEVSCARFESRLGIAPVQNDVFEEFCFEGDYGLPSSVATIGYQAQFKHYKPFGKKWIARTVILEPEPGTTIEAKVMELAEVEGKDEDEKMFSVPQETPEAGQVKSLRLPEDELRKLIAKSAQIVWPASDEGETSGGLSVYVSVDRSGKVREVWPLGAENAERNDPIREQVRHWEFKPAVLNGVSVQVEGVLSFALPASEPAASTGDSGSTATAGK